MKKKLYGFLCFVISLMMISGAASAEAVTEAEGLTGDGYEYEEIRKLPLGRGAGG